jgi:WG containing repeat
MPLRIIFVILIYMSPGAAAYTQTPLFPPPPIPLKTPPVIYYPFYNGIQMIEVDYIAQWMTQGFPQRMQPTAIPWESTHPAPTNAFIFRNREGKILAQYNSTGKQFSAAGLLPPLQTDNKTVSHASRLLRHDALTVKTIVDAAGRYYFYTADGKTGLVDSMGRVVLPPEYDGVECLGRSYLVRKGDYIFLADKDFARLTARLYEETRPCNHPDGARWFVVKTPKGLGIIDDAGNEVVAPQYAGESILFENGFAAVVKKNMSGGYTRGYINRQGREICRPVYDELRGFAEGLAGVSINGKWGFIDTLGRTVIPTKYSSVYFFKDGCTAVQKKVNGKLRYGLINRKDEIVIPFEYHLATPFIDGLALVGINNKYGYINKQNQPVIPMVYDYATLFSNGRARVRLKGEDFYINTKGERLKQKVTDD